MGQEKQPTIEIAGEDYERHWYEHPGIGRVEVKQLRMKRSMIVKLKKRNARYRDLKVGQPYVVIGIEADHLRILNDAGRPFLYQPEIFSLVDESEPVDWVTEIGDEGERYSYPLPLNKAGFFEDYFGQKTKAVGTFWRVVNQRLAGGQRNVA